MTTQNQDMEQGGTSALAAIEFLTPVVKEILDKAEEPEAEKKFATDMLAKFEGMEDKELFLLGHRLDVLHQITNIMLVLLASQGIRRIVAQQPTDPRLS